MQGKSLEKLKCYKVMNEIEQDIITRLEKVSETDNI